LRRLQTSREGRKALENERKGRKKGQEAKNDSVMGAARANRTEKWLEALRVNRPMYLRNIHAYLIRITKYHTSPG